MCICVNGSIFLLILIYENKSEDFMDLWLKDFNCSKNFIYFVVFQKQWTNNELN